MKSIRYSLPVLFSVLIISVAFTACHKSAPPPVQSAMQVGPESYVVATTGTIETGPTISGTLIPRDIAVARAQISGAIKKVFVDQGKKVSEGEILATIDNSALTDAVISAKNAVRSAENSLTVAKSEQDRQASLLKAGAISQQSVDQSQKSAISAEAALAQAKAMLASAVQQESYATVRAPFSGIISEKSVSAGDVVQQGTALFTVVDPSTLELQGNVPANALSFVHVGLKVNFDVTGYPNHPFTGTIARINPTADAMTRQVRIYAEIPNAGKTLVGGLYAEGRIASVLKTTLTLPAEAVDHKTITPAVVMLEHGVAQRKVVTLGTLDEKNDLVEITSGLNAGDTVMRGSAMEIPIGTKVKILVASPNR